MSSPARYLKSVVLLGSIAFAASSCQNTVLHSGAEALNVTVTPNPAGAGRFAKSEGSGSVNSATFDIEKLQVFPTDPAAAAVFGAETEQLRFQKLSGADLSTTQPIPFSTVALATGTYRVTLLRITHPALVDNALPPGPYPLCSVPNWVDGVAVFNTSGSVVFADSPTTPLQFTIHPGQTTLQLKINIPGFLAGYQAAFTCQAAVGDGPNKAVAPFDEAAFQTAFLANLIIE
jgi:hypothetical protein